MLHLTVFLLLAGLLGYLLGSLPTGYLVGRAYGIDVREHGSGNIGATNVVRVLGKKPGYFVFACDAMKGFLSVNLARYVVSSLLGGAGSLPLTPGISQSPGLGLNDLDASVFLSVIGIIAALACILGHNFPVWLRFRGGKGVATTVGTLLGLMPIAFLAVAGIWVFVFYAFRYVSLASILAATALPIFVLAARYWQFSTDGTMPMLCFAIAAAALVWWRHRGNIQRLCNGTEARFGKKAS